MTVADVLDRAADIIAEHGLCQGQWWDDTSRPWAPGMACCVGGAIGVADGRARKGATLGLWVPDEWIDRVHESMLSSPDWEYLLLTKFPGRYVGLDLPPRAWVGTSVDEQKRVRLAEDAFRKIDGVAVKWLSLEPLREPLEFTDLSMFDWVVIGAQTETRQPGGVVPSFAPPFDWVARIVALARDAGCRVHLKPNLLGRTGAKHPGMQLPNEYPEGAS